MRPKLYDFGFATGELGMRRPPAAHSPVRSYSRRPLSVSANQRAVVLVVAFAVLLGCSVAWAQDNPDSSDNSGNSDNTETPVTVGGFNNQGSVTFGYRFDDVKGYRPMYESLSGLGSGFRLLDLSVFGDAAPGANAFADSYSLSVTGLGGEPFQTGQLTVQKSRRFDFRANWRQSYFFWNPNDNVVLPIAPLVGVTTGLTDNHAWDTVRKFGSADLTLYATNRLRFNFDYYRTTNSGPTFTTESLDFFDSPTYWGTYARANPFVLYAPIDENANRFTGGLDYTYRSWTFHYHAGYQVFTENLSMNNVDTPQLSIDSTPSSLLEPLTNLSQSEYRKLSTPISEFSYTGQPLPNLLWQGGYMYYRYQGPGTFDQSFNGIAPNAAGVNAPFTVTQSARVSASETNNILNQTLVYKAKDWWEFIADYRYSRFYENAGGVFNSQLSIVTNPGSATPIYSVTPTSAPDTFAWRDGLSDFDFSMLFTPTRSLTFRPGVQLIKADVESFENGVNDPATTLRTKTVWPELSVGYQPSKRFSIRGSVHAFDSGSSYTALTPHTEVAGHVIGRFQPFKKLSLEDDLNVSNAKLIDSSFQNNVRANTVTLTYAINDLFSIFAGYTYDSTFAAGDIVYARGTPPLNDFLRDQEINRVIQAGVNARPSKYFGFQFTGNFTRSTGLAAISGEPPAYGPLTWPLATGTVYVNFPKAGRLSVDLQRTYYIEQIITANNFQANLLTLRWTRDF